MDLPPSYDSPSAAEEIEISIDLALKLQANLLALQRSVSQLDDSVETVSGAALHYHERYGTFLAESRTSAIELRAAIRSFLTITIPISQSNEYPLDQRIHSVRSTAEKIRSTSKIIPLEFKKIISEIKNYLSFFCSPLIHERRKTTQEAVMLVEMEAEHCENGFFTTPNIWNKLAGRRVTTLQIHNVEVDDPHLSQCFERLDPPSDSGSGIEGKTFFSNPETTEDTIYHAKCNEICQMRDSGNLQKLKQRMRVIASIHDQHKALLEDLEKITTRNDPFEVCWRKLEEDAYMLSEYISDPHGTFQGDDLMERIQSESPVYERIRRALDYYAIKI